MLLPRNQFSEGAPSYVDLPPRWLPDSSQQLLQQLKETLVRQLSVEFSGLLDENLVRRAVNEADSLAVLTPFPHLFLPVLAVEKVQETFLWLNRQQDIWERSVTVITA